MKETFRRAGIEPFAALSFLIPLFIYLLTLAPTVTFFDSGEFLTAVASLGTAHSPGYPLFINYAHPFTWLPFGSIAFRVNFATAVSAALACFGVYLVTKHLLKDEELPEGVPAPLVTSLAALAAALAFCGTARLWLQSNHDKPYPLLSFICAAVFYLMLRWRDSFDAGEERPSYVYLGAFLCGLGTGAHQIMVLMIPAYAFLLLSKEWRIIFRMKEFLIALSFGILGFSIHLHLIVRALAKPLLNWGDSKNLTQFLWNLLRKGYPTEKPQRDLSLLWSQINAFNVQYEFTVVGLLLLIAGLVFFFRTKRDIVLSYLIALFTFLLIIAGYFNTPGELIFLTEEFFTPLYLLSAVVIGLALFGLLRLLLSAFRVRGKVPALGLSALLFVLPLSVVLLHYVENDQHENYIASDYAQNSLRSLPQGAVMFTWGDSGAFPLWYIQGVERMRDDLDLLHTPHLVFEWYLDGFPALFRGSRLRSLVDQTAPEDALLVAVAEQFPRRPVFIDFSTKYSVALPGYQALQHGIVYQLIPASQPLPLPDSGVWALYTQRGVVGASDMFFRDLDTGKAIQIYAAALMESGEILLSAGGGAQVTGAQQLCLGKEISPELAPHIDQILARYGASCR
ncbi:DUF2723 domain-containing protein [Geomonas sp. RF6]|uniref:glycosyltransferase family 117 protein n=1 Tax=Geomonas sp. RF6 TaxID=2897342 RepID=UPI001E31CA92|nr:DUF2723 domain-containing protein [Geomonas sp. RF6]UFS69704.1 DUF2723 domain-containing protein [Geomonas sp. RF6]